MTIQFDPNKNMVRIGDKFFPAKPFPENDSRTETGSGIGYTIPLGESGKELSIAIGVGTYNEHHNLDIPSRVDPATEMETVEVGYNFGDAPSPYEWQDTRGFDVIGWVNDEDLSRMIIRAMDGKDPF